MTLEELRAAVEAMTPGPWEARCHEPFVALVSPQGWLLEADPPVGNDEQDALAIATLRNVAPELIAVIEAATRACAALEAGDEDAAHSYLTHAVDGICIKLERL